MLSVYDHYKYFKSFSAETVFIRQNQTYKDGPRTERVEYSANWDGYGDH